MVSCIPISCIARIQLIATGNHLQTLVLKELVKEHQVEITRDGKVLRHPKVYKTRGDMVPESSVGLGVLEVDS